MRIRRQFWYRGPCLALAAVAIAVACSDGADGPNDNAAGAAGESGVGATTSTAGKSGNGGTKNAGGSGLAGDAPNHPGGAGQGGQSAGAAGQSGAGQSGGVDGGGAGASGAGGADPGGAGAGGHSEAGEGGLGGEGGASNAVTHRCVYETEYCGPEECVQFSAGCVDHKCLPGLANGATCTGNRQCQSGRCDATSHQCVATTYCGCQWDDLACPDGQKCIGTHSVDQCTIYGTQCVTPGAAGTECNAGECEFGLNCYAFPNGTGITRCFWSKTEGQPCSTFDAAYQCGPGLTCVVGEFPPNGVCTGHGNACPCQVGFECGADNLCHPLAKLGESCDSMKCDRKLRCAEVTP